MITASVMKELKILVSEDYYENFSVRTNILSSERRNWKIAAALNGYKYILIMS